jgi:hypothetical protein
MTAFVQNFFLFSLEGFVLAISLKSFHGTFLVLIWIVMHSEGCVLYSLETYFLRLGDFELNLALVWHRHTLGPFEKRPVFENEDGDV